MKPWLLVDLLLKKKDTLDELVLEPETARRLVLPLTTIALACFTVYGVAFHLLAGAPTAVIYGLPLAFVGALGVCLPSFYFYTLLGGVEASWLQITAQSVRTVAATSLLTLGLMPVLVAAALAPGSRGDELGPWNFALGAGYFLPFIAGLLSVGRLYRSLRLLRERLPSTRPNGSALVASMVLAYSVLYTFITPLALGRFLRG